MQIVGNERNLGRKVREAFTAIWLDLRLGKDEVLTRYLNAVYLGAGAYGMSAATRLYFDKSLADVTLVEAALLVGLIQAPSRYGPIRNLVRRIAGLHWLSTPCSRAARSMRPRPRRQERGPQR
jgi:penicillin-binding protein 1A